MSELQNGGNKGKKESYTIKTVYNYNLDNAFKKFITAIRLYSGSSVTYRLALWKSINEQIEPTLSNCRKSITQSEEKQTQ